LSIHFYNIDHNYVGFSGSKEILYELRAKYSFHTKNYKWDKRYKMGYWDGKISLLNLKDMKMYRGLLPKVKSYLDREKIPYEDLTDPFGGRDFTNEQVKLFYKKIEGPFVPRDDQIDAFKNCVSSSRNIILAPTSNGKSYIIHGLNSYYKKLNKKVLIVIHRSNLVLQLKSNFVDEYGSDKIYTTSTIYEDADTDVKISTWQSLKDADQSWFKQFDVIIGDEVHGFKSKSLVNLIDKCGHIEYRHGFTATLDNDSETDALTLEGMFGTPYQTITLKEQINQGISARPIVYVLLLKYPIEERLDLINTINQEAKQALNKGKKVTDAFAFQVESKYIESHERRNQLIVNIAKAQTGNTLIAFKNQAHGKTLLENVKQEISDKPIFFVNGTVKKEKRFDIQKEIETLTESISVVSFGTFSTGVNIPNLNNLIIGSQLKSEITVPQLIGRMVRIVEGKTTTNIIDMCDDLSHSGNSNIFYRHFEQRLKFYLKNNFEIKTKIIAI